MKTLPEIVLCGLKPKVFYRAKDLAQEMAIDERQAACGLRELSRGG